MTFNNIFQFMVPKDKQFFPLFAKSTSNMVEITKSFKDLTMMDATNRSIQFSKIAALKVKNQEISKEINLELVKSFLTPFDKEDIFRLVNEIDKVVNNVAKASKKINIYKIDSISDSMKKLADINLQAVNNVTDGITKLESTKKIQTIITKSNDLESSADTIHDQAIEDLFANENDAKKIMMHREVISALESVTDKCKAIADTLELIVAKHT